MLLKTLIEEEDNSLLLKLKKVATKEDIYWVAEPWIHLNRPLDSIKILKKILAKPLA